MELANGIGKWNWCCGVALESTRTATKSKQRQAKASKGKQRQAKATPRTGASLKSD
jgi:hypothetical protein